MADKKPKIFEGGKDMALSMVVIIALMAAVVLPTGLCSYNPGKPENGPVQQVDAGTFMSMEARAENYPIYLPTTPDGWFTNSARRTDIDNHPAPVIGWVTSGKGFLQLTQVDINGSDVAKKYDGSNRHKDSTEQAGSLNYEVYKSDDDGVRDLWVASRGSTTFLISGAASHDEFMQLATKTAEAVDKGPVAKS